LSFTTASTPTLLNGSAGITSQLVLLLDKLSALLAS
jgi:hypothetical protein